MPCATAAVTLEICVNIQEAVYLEILYVTLDLAFRCHVPDNLVHSLDRIPISMRILRFAQEMIINFLVDIFGILAPPDKVVAVHQLEDVNVRHASFC